MRETLDQLVPYRPPEARGVALHRNTNRLGSHPAAGDIASLLAGIDLSEYPDGEALPLRRALARRYGLDPECFLVGNGSNEVFELLLKALLNPGEAAAYPGPTYSMYRHSALVNAVRPLEAPLGEGFALNAQALLATDARAFVLCTPNNPTGNAFAPEAVEEVLRSGRWVIIDEAYAEFGAQNWLVRVGDYPNLIVVRTFSKAYGLAGLRVGYAAASPKLIEQIHRAQLPYNVNAVSQALATAALREPAFVEEYVTLIRRQRPHWTEALEARGFRVWPSQANFLLAEVPRTMERDALVERLAANGVLVRSAGTHPRLKRCIRVTVGVPNDLRALLQAVDGVLP